MASREVLGLLLSGIVVGMLTLYMDPSRSNAARKGEIWLVEDRNESTADDSFVDIDRPRKKKT